jgi:DoxX-like protein
MGTSILQSDLAKRYSNPTNKGMLLCPFHSKMGIYVEILIRSSMNELWEKTQNPELHQRWDLRFTRIEYLPRESEEPQRFLYCTQIGFGLKIDGKGESSGTKNADDGTRTSSLEFWSADPKSLIKTGSGYWKYVPAGNEIRFFTWYDYNARFGPLGKAIDSCLFRPLIGWATAWSFDRLRLWIECGIPPEASRDRALAYSVARGTLAFIWLYHGLIPKLLHHDAIELDLLSRIGTPASLLITAVMFLGWVEILLGLVLIILWRHRWPLWLTLALMLVGIPVVAVSAPAYLGAAFNPLTLNLAIAALSAVGLIASHDCPTAVRCRRKPPQS